MKEYRLPTREQCLEMAKEYHVPVHILRHSLSVAKLAVFLAERLKEKGVTIDVDLVERACLLHDIVRVCDFNQLDCKEFGQNIAEQDKAKWEEIRARYGGIGHEDAAYDILREEYPALALTIKKHRYTAMLDEAEKPDTWEEKLVYYADMRVMHDRIVPLEERLKEAHKRNVFLHATKIDNESNIAAVDPLIHRLEEEIFDKVGLNPVEVTGEFIDSYANKMRRER